MIDHFDGEYRWLSNFSWHKVVLDGITYPTLEHAYQAAKTYSLEDREWIRSQPTPGRAKRAGSKRGIDGHTITMRHDWDDVKIHVMTELACDKFYRHPDLAAKLVATDNEELIEGNYWHDTFWGVCNGSCRTPHDPRGANHLGRILMEVRALLTIDS